METRENSLDDGGPAFASVKSISSSTTSIEKTDGMSLRDYFAGEVQVTESELDYACETLGLLALERGPAAFAMTIDADAYVRFAKADAMLRRRKVK